MKDPKRLKRLAKRGEPGYNGTPPVPEENWGDLARLMYKVEVNQDGCWMWKGARRTDRDGQIRTGLYLNGRLLSGTMAAWIITRGPVADGLEMDHYRMNPGPREAPCSTMCVNPDHLEPVSHRENVLRGRSPMAINSRKTHCPQGHELRDENLVKSKWRRLGLRECRLCHNSSSKKYYENNKERFRRNYLRRKMSQQGAPI